MGQSLIDSNRRYVGTKETFFFGIANGGQVMSFSLITSYLTYFYVNIFNIDPKIVATMLFLEGIWDTINDPIMGSIVDRTRTRFGKIHPYLLGVPLPLAIATVMYFTGPMILHNPSPTAPSKVIYMIISYFCWEFLYTISDVPFWGMAAAISPSPADRTRTITAARFISSIVGGIPTLFMPILIDLSKNNIVHSGLRQIFFVAGVTFGIIGMALFALSGIFVKERVAQSIDAPKMKDCYQCITKNPPLKLIILQNLLGSLGGIGGIFATYYFIDVLGSASASIIIGIPGTIISFASFAFIAKIKKKFNNKQIVIGNKIFNDSLSIIMFILSIKKYTDIRFMIPLMMLKSTITSFLSGVNAVVPTEMIADTVDYMEWKTGQRSEGMSFSVLTFVGKLNGAIARSLGALLISVIGYKTSQTNAIIPQTDAVKFKIFAMNTIVPTLLGLFSIVPIFFYDLVGDKQKRILKELAERREKLAENAAN
jgi:sugar (glycoside-pentoside-hexuronide) transporter